MSYKPGVPIPVGRADFGGVTTLFLAMQVWDITGTPVLVSQIPMPHVALGAYSAQFTPSANRLYQVINAVYTDGTYTVVDGNYAPGEMVYRIDAGQDGSDVVQVAVSSLLSGTAVDVSVDGLMSSISVAVSDLSN